MPSSHPIPNTARSQNFCEKATFADYLWLAYSIFFFFEPIFRNSRAYWIKCIALFLPFLATYIALAQARRRQTRLIFLVLLTGLGLLGMSFNGGASCFLTFAAAFAPFILESTGAVLLFLGGQLLLVLLEARLLHLEWVNAVIAVVLISIVGTTNLFIAQKKRNTASLLRAQDEIEQLAALAERERIARDMHDVLGHTLSVIVLKSELAGRLLARNPDPSANNATVLQEITDIEATARKALAEVREAIGGYRAQGLAAEIDLARRTLATAAVTLTADITPNLSLSPTEETILSLAVREAVTNVIRHARASRCDLHLTATAAGHHTLTLADNGSTLTAAPPREGNGLRGMRERITSLGGTLILTPSPAGTTLQIHLPPATSIHASGSSPAPTRHAQETSAPQAAATLPQTALSHLPS